MQLTDSKDAPLRAGHSLDRIALYCTWLHIACLPTWLDAHSMPVYMVGRRVDCEILIVQRFSLLLACNATLHNHEVLRT